MPFSSDIKLRKTFHIHFPLKVNKVYNLGGVSGPVAGLSLEKQDYIKVSKLFLTVQIIFVSSYGALPANHGLGTGLQPTNEEFKIEVPLCQETVLRLFWAFPCIV